MGSIGRRSTEAGGRLADIVTVLTILLLLCAILVPAMSRIAGNKEDRKNDEVKANLHSIQLALERYATDNAGTYPFFLYGGSARFNIGVMAYCQPTGDNTRLVWIEPIHIPFDMFWLNTNTWDYHDAGEWTAYVNRPDEPTNGFGDALAYGGYMPNYPRNPFVRGPRAVFYGLQGLNTNAPYFAGYGGADGGLMWDMSQGMGELPQFQCYADDVDGSLAFPGSFYYHARFADGVTSSGHFRYQAGNNPDSRSYNYESWMPGGTQSPPLNDSFDVVNHTVAGYDLAAVGSPQTPGMDIDNSVGVGSSMQHYWRTGYFTMGGERNPWVQEGDYPGVHDYDERPYSDGIPDYFIIHLTEPRT